jgi:hypothetical protein
MLRITSHSDYATSKTNMTPAYVGAGVLALVGLGLEICGIIKYR